MLNENTLNSLKTLGNVKEITENKKGLEFYFENSLKANVCKLYQYQDRYIIQLRKTSKNPLTEQEEDKLVYESIIKEQEFVDVFEKVTGIYLSGLIY